MIDLDAIIAKVTRREPVEGGFWVAVPRSQVGSVEESAWNHCSSRTGAASEDLAWTEHTDTHWRFYIVPVSSPPPTFDYYRRLKTDYIDHMEPLVVKDDSDVFRKIIDLKWADEWEMLKPYLSPDLIKRLSKPSWVGNRPGLAGYYLRQIVLSKKQPFDLDAAIDRVSPRINLDDLIARATRSDPDPPPPYRRKSASRSQSYRLRLSPGEHRALLCLVVAGVKLDNQPLTQAVCRCLGAEVTKTVSQRQRLMKRARDRGLLDMSRIPGSSDMDVTLDARLLGPLRKAANQAIDVPLCVGPRYHPLEEHLIALTEALCPRGLVQRQYHGDS